MGVVSLVLSESSSIDGFARGEIRMEQSRR